MYKRQVCTYAVIGITLRSSCEIAAVNKVKAVNVSVVFGCVFITDCNKRIVERTATAVTTVYALIAAHNRLSCNMPLPRPRTVKVEYFPLGTAEEIHRRAHCRIKEQLLSPVYDFCTASDSIQILKYRIGKKNVYILIGIFEMYRNGLDLIPLLAIGGGKPL